MEANSNDIGNNLTMTGAAIAKYSSTCAQMIWYKFQFEIKTRLPKTQSLQSFPNQWLIIIIIIITFIVINIDWKRLQFRFQVIHGLIFLSWILNSNDGIYFRV